MDEIVKKWSDLGFTYGMTDKEKIKILSYKYEEMEQLIQTNTGYSEAEKWIECVMFPVLRRVFSHYNNINVKHLFMYFKEWSFINYERVMEESKKAYNYMDVEAEEVFKFSDDYICKFKTIITPNRFINKHTF